MSVIRYIWWIIQPFVLLYVYSCVCIPVCFYLQEVSEPTKEEKAVAKYLRFNCPTKSTNMMGHRVDYFIGQCSAENTRHLDTWGRVHEEFSL